MPTGAHRGPRLLFAALLQCTQGHPVAVQVYVDGSTLGIQTRRLEDLGDTDPQAH